MANGELKSRETTGPRTTTQSLQQLIPNLRDYLRDTFRAIATEKSKLYYSAERLSVPGVTSERQCVRPFDNVLFAYEQDSKPFSTVIMIDYFASKAEQALHVIGTLCEITDSNISESLLHERCFRS